MNLCSKCSSEINNEAFSKVTQINGMGRILLGKASVCKQCGSFVMTTFISFFYLPLVPLKSYRGFADKNGNFSGNRIKFSWLQLDMLFYIVWALIIILASLKVMGKW